MISVATEAANRLSWVYYPSLIIGSDLLARSGLIGEDSAAEEVIPAIRPVYSFSIIGRIVELLSIDAIGSLIDYPRFVEADFIGIVIDRRIYSQHQCY